MEQATNNPARVSVPRPDLSCVRMRVRLPAPFWLALTAGCAGPQSALQPSGEGARAIHSLTMALLLVSLAVILAVSGALLWATLRRRTAPVDSEIVDRGSGTADRGSTNPEERATRWVLVAGAGIPAVVITAIFFASVALLAFLARRGEQTDFAIEVTGNRWWWRVNYLDPRAESAIISANEIHIPAGRRVRIHLISTDVIHSFWVPRLNGKVDLIPGRVNVTWLHADRPGVYRGQCAEFCGLQHARMALHVVVHEPTAFAAWLAHEREPAQLPPAGGQAELGYRAFLVRCASCHTVRGTPARGVSGPDLTHLAARRSLAAGTLPNYVGHRAAWLTAPQVIKPGNLMPNPELDAGTLQHLNAFLTTLR
ncbi:MAG: cytochrome c oxidase subunit II [Gemmatimonadota bacterium]